MSVETLSSVPTMSAEIASASFQPILPATEAGISFSFNPSMGTEIIPSTINLPTVAKENIFDLPIYKPNFDLGITRITPELSINYRQTSLLGEYDIQPLGQMSQAEESIAYNPIPETEADKRQLSNALETLHSFGFSRKEKQAWTTKLQAAAKKEQTTEDELLEKPKNVILAQVLFRDSPDDQQFWITKLLEMQTQAMTSSISTIEPTTEIDQQKSSPIYPKTTQPSTQTLDTPSVRPIPALEAQTAIAKSVGNDTEAETIQELVGLITEETGSGINNPNRPKIQNYNEEEEPQGEEAEWNEFRIKENETLSRTSLKKRRGVAKSIIGESSASETPLASIVVGKIYKLDMPDLLEARAIAAGDLDYPQVSINAQKKLTFVENKEDVEEVGAALDQAITSTPPIEKAKTINYVSRKKESQLEPQPRALAKKGAKYIAFLKQKVWVPLIRQKLTNPIELEKVKEAA